MGLAQLHIWSARHEKLPDDRGLRFKIELDSRPASVADILRAWQTDAHFRDLFIALLAEAPYAAFRWETPAVSTATLDKPFEFVLLDSPGLARRPDRQAFAEHFDSGPSTVVTFPSLGGGAILVVPCPIIEPSAYGHLAAFVRLAPQAQRHALWQSVGAAMTQRISAKPVWLSTAGAGVSWLHVRLDDRPKYYGFGEYR